MAERTPEGRVIVYLTVAEVAATVVALRHAKAEDREAIGGVLDKFSRVLETTTKGEQRAEIDE